MIIVLKIKIKLNIKVFVIIYMIIKNIHIWFLMLESVLIRIIKHHILQNVRVKMKLMSGWVTRKSVLEYFRVKLILTHFKILQLDKMNYFQEVYILMPVNTQTSVIDTELTILNVKTIGGYSETKMNNHFLISIFIIKIHT